MSERTAITRAEIRALTQARLTFGARGRALDTAGTLSFALDHAQARAAVLTDLDVTGLCDALDRVGLAHHRVTSLAGTRETFIRRPDLGRRLPDGAEAGLAGLGSADVALVLGDGLSATAVHLNGVAFMAALAERLAALSLCASPVILAQQARVALGDKIALATGAETVVIALGERPGLSAADSLGVYITHRPGPATPDSGRNCISNIREGGIGVAEAADQTARLITAMRRTGHSGVALSQGLATGTLTAFEANT
jgi:ethanolamine ammonia-lyase small subunit